MIEAGAAPDTLLPAESEIDAIVRGQHGNPFAVLGMHPDGEAQVVRVFAPDAAEVAVVDAGSGEVRLSLRRAHPEGFFAGRIRGRRFAYRLRLKAGDTTWERDDPYAFEPVLGDMDEYLIAEGRHEELWRRLGAHPMTHGDADGVAFAVWAPNARRVSVVGDFNSWDGRRHVMRKRHGAGLWELFVPGLSKGDLYKFEIVGAYGELLPLKSDPLSFRQQPAPETSSIVHGLPRHAWSDEAWVKRRAGDRPQACAGLDLRGPSGLLAAGRGRGDPRLRHRGRAPGRVRDRHGLHPCRAPARLGAPLHGLLGLPADRALRADLALRRPRRLRGLRGPAARGGPRRHRRLGARALSVGHARARALRRHRALRARGSAPRLPPRLETR